jgi:hypothetical protein
MLEESPSRILRPRNLAACVMFLGDGYYKWEPVSRLFDVDLNDALETGWEC